MWFWPRVVFIPATIMVPRGLANASFVRISSEFRLRALAISFRICILWSFVLELMLCILSYIQWSLLVCLGLPFGRKNLRMP